MGSNLSYIMSKKPPTEQGVGANLNDIKELEGVSIYEVPKNGPFDSAKVDTPKVEVQEFWKDQTVVLHLLRRFGCPLCRKAAVEISSLKPVLDEHNIRLVGIGLGYNSLDGFIEGNYWRGNELYVDEEKKLYKALKLGKQNILGIFDAKATKARKATKEANIEGNLSGDGMSLGGTYVIEKGGKILLEFQQKSFGDHPELEDILKALNIDLSEMEKCIKEPPVKAEMEKCINEPPVKPQ